MAEVIEIQPEEIASLLERRRVVLVDVREPHEFLSERIEGALLFPLSTFDPACLPSVNEDRPIVFHCGAGRRSAAAVEKCLEAGFSHCRHMTGGFGAWKNEGLPYLRLDPATGQVCGVCHDDENK